MTLMVFRGGSIGYFCSALFLGWGRNVLVPFLRPAGPLCWTGHFKAVLK